MCVYVYGGRIEREIGVYVWIGIRKRERSLLAL